MPGAESMTVLHKLCTAQHGYVM